MAHRFERHVHGSSFKVRVDTGVFGGPAKSGGQKEEAQREQLDGRFGGDDDVPLQTARDQLGGLAQ